MKSMKTYSGIGSERNIYHLTNAWPLIFTFFIVTATYGAVYQLVYQKYWNKFIPLSIHAIKTKPSWSKFKLHIIENHYFQTTKQREILVKKIQICITCSNNLTKIHTNAKSPICLPSSYNMGKIQALESLEKCPWNKNSGMVGQTDNWM